AAGGSRPGRAPDLLGHAEERPRRRSLTGPGGSGAVTGGTLGSMPWLPELFSAPVLQQVFDQRRRDALVAVPYFDGLLAGDPDPLVESFAGAPELHDPIRGRVRDEAAFRAFVTET